MPSSATSDADAMTTKNTTWRKTLMCISSDRGATLALLRSAFKHRLNPHRDVPRLSSSTGPEELRVHRPVVIQRHPAANNPVDEPEAHEGDRNPRDQDADAKCHEHKEDAERDPQQPEPERPDLPSEVRLEPRAARLAPLHVVHNHRDDRRPAGEEGADHARGAEDAGKQAERVQRVDGLRPRHERT